MSIIYIPKQRSPWEQMLPQILGQMALMKVQQNYRAKQQEMELGQKVALAGGKTLTEEETKTPVKEGYRRAKVGGKTYSLPLTTEEKFAQQGVFKIGPELYKDLGGGQFQRITDSSKYQPKLFIDKDGNYKWVGVGEPVPKGYKRYSATTAKGTTPPTKQRLWEYYKGLPEAEQKTFKKFMAFMGSIDPFNVLMQEALLGDEAGAEPPEEMSTSPERLPGETAEEYIDRMEKLGLK